MAVRRIHVLPGDAFAGAFVETGIDGETVVCRECLVDGDLDADSLDAFWELRSSYLGRAYPESGVDYHRDVRAPLERLAAAGRGTDVSLWFEQELFCQANLWFCLSLIRERDLDVHVVYPRHRDRARRFDGFSERDTGELREDFEARVALDAADVELGSALWRAFRHRNWRSLARLGAEASPAFPTLPEVVAAACEIATRPRRTVRAIIADGASGFGAVFREFTRREPVYGFGDLQVRRVYDALPRRGA